MNATAADRRHVVVINDTPAILDLFAALLGEDGYRVTVNRFSEPPESLLKAVRDLRPDLVILDLIVNHEDLGWQFLQMLKMDRGTRAIPVIVCTAAARLASELELHLDSMNVRVVLKPFDIDDLLDRMRRTWTDPTALSEPPA